MEGSLVDHFSALQRGEEIVFRWRQNQYGDLVPVRSLFFERGEWKVWEVVCSSSRDYGFGTCHCQSHSPTQISKVSRREALELLQEHLEEEQEEEEEKAGEIAWLADLLRQPS